MTPITAKTIRQMLLTGLALAAVVLLGGLQEAQAGIDVWTATGPEGGTIRALAIDPQNPATLYAVVSGDASNSYSNSDVFKSTDADSTGTSRTFAFSPAPRVLDSLSVFSPTPRTLTLTDDAGQTLTREVTTGSMQWVTTGMEPAVHYGDGELHQRVGSRPRRHHLPMISTSRGCGRSELDPRTPTPGRPQWS
jgi:hypothetical protein